MNNFNLMHSTRKMDAKEECRQVRQNLPGELLGELDEDISSILFQHVSQCRSCLEAYIALQAAAELAGVNHLNDASC